MADSNLQRRGASQHFDHSDPFAELSRIIGADPHAEAAKASDDPFDIDLEKELMGTFDDATIDDALAEDGTADAGSLETEAVGNEPETAESTFDEAFAEEIKGGGWTPEDPAGAAPAEMQAESATAMYARWDDHPDYGQSDRVAESAAADASEADDEVGLAEVDMDFGDLDFADDASAEEHADAPTDPVAAGEVDAGRPQSLEDELSMLLSGGESQDAGYLAATDDDAGYETTQGEAGGEEAAPNESYAPTYGRANFASQSRVADGWDSDDDATDEFVAEELEAEPAEDSIPADEEPAEPLPAQEPPADPFSIFSSIAPAATVPAFLRRPSAAARPPVSQAPLPDVETVDVAEASVPMQDDLDLPAVAFEDSTPVGDEFDDDFAEAFGRIAEPTESGSGQPAAAAARQEEDYFSETLGFGTAANGAAWATARPAAAQFGDEPAENDASRDLEDDIGVSGYGAAPAAGRRRSGMMIAAAVVGVAVLGGLGAFALSFGSGDADEAPVLVKADNEPLKVKPENPGGTTVPNQESQAYQRASGVVDDAPPAQEKLVTTTEEPVNLAAAAETDTALPMDEDEPVPADADADAQAASQGGAKSEARLEASAQPDGVGASEDLAMVQPRKVRTMIVKPDGTLVAREEPAPQPQMAAEPAPAQPIETAAAAPAASVAAPAAEAINEVSTKLVPPQAAVTEQPQAPAAEPAPQPETAAAEPTIVTPSVGPIAPSRPAQQPVETVSRNAAPQQAPAPERKVAQAAPAQARSQPAAAPAAGASDWSMQIASQPTVEAAQASYQNLARRYEGVIGGRGVNIVKAEVPNKGTYYRVRIPSNSRDDAISLCEKYKAAGGSCFVSK